MAQRGGAGPERLGPNVTPPRAGFGADHASSAAGLLLLFASTAVAGYCISASTTEPTKPAAAESAAAEPSVLERCGAASAATAAEPSAAQSAA